MRKTMSIATRAGGTLAAAGLLVLVGAGVAAAHVSAHSPDSPAKGGDAEIVFRVPAEEDTAGTVKVQVNFSTTSPIGDANVRPVPGWTFQVTKTHLATPVKMTDLTVTDAVQSITWTAQPGTRINPGEFQEFAIAVEGLPTNTDTMVMPAVQTYDNGDVVQWNQPTVAGQPEPEHPAPHLALALAAADTTDAPAAAATNATSGTTSTTSGSSSDSTARWLGGIGLVLAALALGIGLGAFLRGRRPTRSTEEGTS